MRSVQNSRWVQDAKEAGDEVSPTLDEPAIARIISLLVQRLLGHRF